MAATAKAKTWTKTKVQGLLRHRSGTYYARLHLAGKEKWLSLGTKIKEVAKAKLDEEKGAIAEAKKTGWEAQAGRVTVAVAIAAYQENLRLRVKIKESTRKLYLWQLQAILKSWPELPELDVRAVSPLQCSEWAKKFSAQYSAAYYNSSLVLETNCFLIDQIEKLTADMVKSLRQHPLV